MFDFKCGTENVETTIRIVYLIFISTFYNNILYVLMRICFYYVQHCILVCLFVFLALQPTVVVFPQPGNGL
jgi:hypothetical protein